MNLRVINALFLAAAFAAPVNAQNLAMTMPATASDPISTPAVPVTATNYQLSPADVIRINVLNFPDLSVPQTMVSPDGTVSLPLVQAVTVTGMTTTQASEMLTKKFRRYLVKPAVSVALVQKHEQLIVFSGFLNKPGSLAYRPGLHLVDALAEAGGAIPERSNPADATVTHVDGSKQTFDLTYPQTKKGTATDIELAPGDVVYIPEQLEKVSITGEVKQPGSLTYNDHLTVLEAITASGGYLSDTADLRAATLTHNGEKKPIDLYAMLKNGDMSANANLGPGDTIDIPKIHNRVYIFGDVAHPGYYLFEPGDRVTDALSGAGGPTPRADLGKVNVIQTHNGIVDVAKVQKDNGTSEMRRVCLNDFLLKGDIKGNPLISPGDALYIPDKKYTLSVGDVLGAVNAAGSLAYTKRLIENR